MITKTKKKIETTLRPALSTGTNLAQKNLGRTYPKLCPKIEEKTEKKLKGVLKLYYNTI